MLNGQWFAYFFKNSCTINGRLLIFINTLTALGNIFFLDEDLFARDAILMWFRVGFALRNQNLPTRGGQPCLRTRFDANK